MITTLEGPLREVFLLWSAYSSLVEHLQPTWSVKHADPRAVYGAIDRADRTALVTFLYALGYGESRDEAAVLLDELAGMARAGRRPRFGRELGLVWPGVTG